MRKTWGIGSATKQLFKYAKSLSSQFALPFAPYLQLAWIFWLKYLLKYLHMIPYRCQFFRLLPYRILAYREVVIRVVSICVLQRTSSFFMFFLESACSTPFPWWLQSVIASSALLSPWPSVFSFCSKRSRNCRCSVGRGTSGLGESKRKRKTRTSKNSHVFFKFCLCEFLFPIMCHFVEESTR